MEKQLHEIELNVPVTNPLPRSDKALNRMIGEFKRAGFRFGLFERSPGLYELWREAQPGEGVADHKHGVLKNDLIETRYPPIEAFSNVWEGSTVLKGLGAAGVWRK